MSYEFKPVYSKAANDVSTNPIKYVSVHRKCDGENKSECLCVITERYQEIAERIKNLTVRDDDIWIVTYPKSGTTWTQEMVWLITHDLDYKTAKEVLLTERSQFVEFTAIALGIPDTIDGVNNMESPRNIKTHLHFSMIPDQIWEKKPKIIYVARNPKDVVVSYYHHSRMIEGYVGTLDDFADAFLNDKLIWSPYWNHILDAWNLRNEENILFITYEDMKKNLLDVIKNICRFLNKSYTESQLEQLVNHLQFDNMKNNNSCNYTNLIEQRKKATGLDLPPELTFMRSGKTGGWKTEMNEKLAQRIDEWSRKNTEGTGYNLWDINNL